MTQKVYQLKYDSEFDKDIDKWLKGLPRSKKAEHVRHALRFYIAYAQDSKTPVFPGVVMPVAVPSEQATPTVAEEDDRTRPDNLGLNGLEDVNQ